MLSFVLELGREEWAGWVLTVPIPPCPCPSPSLPTDPMTHGSVFQECQGLLSQLLHALQAHLPRAGTPRSPRSAGTVPRQCRGRRVPGQTRDSSRVLGTALALPSLSCGPRAFRSGGQLSVGTASSCPDAAQGLARAEGAAGGPG